MQYLQGKEYATVRGEASIFFRYSQGRSLNLSWDLPALSLPPCTKMMELYWLLIFHPFPYKAMSLCDLKREQKEWRKKSYWLKWKEIEKEEDKALGGLKKWINHARSSGNSWRTLLDIRILGGSWSMKENHRHSTIHLINTIIWLKNFARWCRASRKYIFRQIEKAFLQHIASSRLTTKKIVDINDSHYNAKSLRGQSSLFINLPIIFNAT